MAHHETSAKTTNVHSMLMVHQALLFSFKNKKDSNKIKRPLNSMELIWSATWFGTDCEKLLKEGHLTTGWKKDDKREALHLLDFNPLAY